MDRSRPCSAIGPKFWNGDRCQPYSREVCGKSRLAAQMEGQLQ